MLKVGDRRRFIQDIGGNGDGDEFIITYITHGDVATCLYGSGDSDFHMLWFIEEWTRAVPNGIMRAIKCLK